MGRFREWGGVSFRGKFRENLKEGVWGECWEVKERVGVG